jgi:hypothetical protein
VARQVKVRCNQHEGFTLNVSDRGARVVVRGELPRHFELTLLTVQVKAERVWEQPLGPGGTRVVGVRFTTNREVADWVDRQR